MQSCCDECAFGFDFGVGVDRLADLAAWMISRRLIFYVVDYEDCVAAEVLSIVRVARLRWVTAWLIPNTREIFMVDC